ncbi:MAG: 1,6-anhydro-N-acetylmuramyl-L-alanine amidase AmpD [Betaproteobacteria bacterium]|jgi:AmpD protein|nr:1,6-anhydro-N-acetylmuramyl-L-alanine amidase AmpD [Betaproteobacteria bacterium]
MGALHFDQQGWLISGARRSPSPHWDARPVHAEIALAVIHNISLPAGCFEGSAVEELFLGRLNCEQHPSFSELAGLRVSAHFFVRRSGEIIQFVRLQDRAWHAGVSEFLGRPACNDFSIGLELEGADDVMYSDIQMQATADVLAAACSALPNLKWIAGHADIAPGRKTDPGPAFSWPEMLRLLNGRGCLLTRPYP